MRRSTSQQYQVIRFVRAAGTAVKGFPELTRVKSAFVQARD
jgi:hypothetical protein